MELPDLVIDRDSLELKVALEEKFSATLSVVARIYEETQNLRRQGKTRTPEEYSKVATKVIESEIYRYIADYDFESISRQEVWRNVGIKLGAYLPEEFKEAYARVHDFLEENKKV